MTFRLMPAVMRLDVFLTTHGYTLSRTEAQNYIKGGKVSVNGSVITKSSFVVLDEESVIVIDKSENRYVSRGGIKLEGALREFSIDVSERLCIDIGASSGGFTDCLLQKGAKHVISIDSGSGQIAESLRIDDRVTIIENYNARYMASTDFEYIPNLAVMDVSFISATYIIPSVYSVLSLNSDFVCLIKPQFEVGRSGLSKGGIVKDIKEREKGKQKVLDFAESHGFKTVAVTQSPIKGGDGNVEYLAHFRKE